MSRPSDLTPELTLQIRAMVLDNVKYKDIQAILEVPDNTWDAWVYKDYKDFRKDLKSWKIERLLKKSEKLSEEILDAVHFNDKGEINTDVLRVKQKESEFIRGTLGKNEGYSSRSELTGSDGKDLFIKQEEKDLIDKALTEY